MLIYAGRIDNEKRADRLVEMMRRLPESFGAALVLYGDGKLREQLMVESAQMPVAMPGFLDDREELAVALASSDIYVSAMADETFGISVIEAQACGLPVVGVAAGAMPERVRPGLGLLGPVDDVSAMARNVAAVWQGDRSGIGNRARTHAVTRFNWERTFSHLIGEIYFGPRQGRRTLRQTRSWVNFAPPRLMRKTG